MVLEFPIHDDHFDCHCVGCLRSGRDRENAFTLNLRSAYSTMKELFLSALTGHGVALPLGTLVLAGICVFFVASRLAHHADAIAETTGLGRIWIGSLLLAGSTSMPEIVADISAAAFGLPNIGVGDLFGSTLANMSILALLSFVYARKRLLQNAALDHALVGALGIALTALAGMSIASGGFGGVFGIGFDTLVIGLLFIVGMRVVFDLTQGGAQSTSEEESKRKQADSRLVLRRALLGFGVATLGLLLVVPFLIFSADAVATEAGVTDTFVGTFLVGLTTSFPELAAAVAAVRLGAIDLAVGNIFGSNAFNMTVLLMMDIAHRGKPLLASVSHGHVVSSFAAVMAMALGVMAILARTHKQAWVTRMIASLIVMVYGASFYLLARMV